MDTPAAFNGIQLTATDEQPAFVKPGTPIKSPTVWYGQDITAEVRPSH